MININNSQVANGDIKKSKNSPKTEYQTIKKECVLISFIVGFLASIVASYCYEHIDLSEFLNSLLGR